MANRSLHPLVHYLRRLSQPTGPAAVDDVQLLDRFLRQHDEQAFAALVQRHGGMVWSLCVRQLGETQEAEDAFQATFLVLVRKAASLRNRQMLAPWLFGVAQRTALKLRSQRARRSGRETLLFDQAATEQQPDTLVRELGPLLDEEIERLPEIYRRPVVLCYRSGLSREEAAKQLGCATGTVFSRLSRGRDLLRQRLVRRGQAIAPDSLALALVSPISRLIPPLTLCESTLQTALTLAAGSATIAVPVASLMEGVLRTMALNQLKWLAGVLLTISIVGTGGGVISARYLTQGESGQPAPKADPAAQQPKKPDTVATPVPPKTDPAGGEKTPVVKPVIDGQSKASTEGEPLAAIGSRGLDTRLSNFREVLLHRSIDVGLQDDPKKTLIEFLIHLGQILDVNFEINEKAFQKAGLSDVEKFEVVGVKTIRAMQKTNLATVLRIVLSRLPCEATYVLRYPNTIEITTREEVREELRIPEDRPLLPLVWESFEKKSILTALAEVVETTGYNIAIDPRLNDKKDGLLTKITLQFNNVPVDTAVRTLANMAGLWMVPMDNVFYITTEENAKKLSVNYPVRAREGQ